MSDPVSNEDIEDVLSSIRRLVSDEPIKGMPRRKLAPVDNVERFVLTPAFRVPDEDLAPDIAVEETNSQEDQGLSETVDLAIDAESPQETQSTHTDEPDDHLPTQDEIDLQPYQPDSEWVEPKLEKSDRLDAEIAEDAKPKHPDPEPLYLESAANQDEAPFLDAQSDGEKDEFRFETEQSDESHSDDTQDDNAADDDFWQNSLEYAPETQSVPELGLTEEPFDVDVEALFEEETSELTAPSSMSATSESQPVSPDHGQHTALSGQITLEQRIAELEAALQNSAQEWEPDGSEEELTDETRPLSVGKDARLADAIASVAQTLEQNSPEPEERWQPSTDSTGPAPIEALYANSPIPTLSDEDSNLADDDTVEWQDVEQEFDADFSHETEESVEAAVQEDEADHNTAAMQAASQDLAQEAADDERDNDLFAMDEPTTLDEEALQELVADIVRQELQGVLGERITRNVRRLVRREIKRALAMRDLE